MSETIDHEQAINDCLDSFNHFYAEPYDPEYTGGLFNDFSEFAKMTIGETISKLDPYLVKMAEIAGKEGKCTAGELTIRTSNDDADSLMMTAFNAKDVPQFTIKRSLRPEQDSKRIIDTTIRLANDDETPVCRNTWGDMKGRIFSRGTCRIHDFENFVKAAQLLKHALEVDADVTPAPPTRDAQYSDEAVLLAAEGGIPGPLALQVAHIMQQKVGAKAFEWCLPAVQELAAAMDEKGLKWGESYLLYNDLDISICSLPMKTPNQVGIFNQNVSLISDEFAYVAVVDLDPEGEPQMLRFRSINRSENVGKTVEEIIEGTGHFDILYDPASELMSRLSVTGGKFDHKGLIEHAAFYIHCDHEVVVGGEMDDERADDCRTIKDFSGFYEMPETDDDEDYDPLTP